MGQSAKERMRAGSRIEWLTLALIVICYGLWALAGLVLWPAWPVAALFLLALTVAFHSSLAHEVLHGHPTRSPLLNEALVALPLGFIWPYRRYRKLHLRHHHDERLTDPFDDPESYYRALWKYESYPRWFRVLLGWNNTLLGRMILGPLLGTAALILGDWRAWRSGDPSIANAWGTHLLGLVPVLAIIHSGFGLPLWLYLLVPVWAGHSLISIRTFAEHQWAERPEGRTIIVERSLLSLLFLNNNLHLVHHKHPTVPWYRLPRLYNAERQVWAKLNGGYIFRNYLLIFLLFALKKKEPVAHPVLQREPDMRNEIVHGRHLVPDLRHNEVTVEPPRD